MEVFQETVRLEAGREGVAVGGAVERFSTELKRLYEDAGEPTLGQLVRLAAKQAPPIKISDSTISTWLNAGHVPAPGPKEKYFALLVTYLRKQAAARGHQHMPEGAWLQLLHAAREERSALRGGRPAKARVSPEVSRRELRTVETLPPRPVGLVGRESCLADLLSELDPAREKAQPSIVTAVSGMGGSGKTTLAIEAAYRARDLGLFSGGVLFLDMRGYSSNDSDLKAENAAEQLLRYLGVPEADIPPAGSEVLDLWRTHAAYLGRQERPFLLILDSVSAASQVLPLIPSFSQHRIIVTTRHVLASLPGRQIELNELSGSSAAQLLDQALRVARPDDQRVASAPEDADQLAALCGGLPLALQIVAALLKIEPKRPLASLIDELKDTRSRLGGLQHNDIDVLGNPLATRAAFMLSYRRLSTEEARAYRLLALAPGPHFSMETAGILLEAPPSVTRSLIRTLMSANLLLSNAQERWMMHDLIRLYAEEKADEDTNNVESSGALQRILLHLLEVAEEADGQLSWTADEAPSERFLSPGEARNWLDDEYSTLLAAVSYAHYVELDIISIAITLRLERHFAQNCRLGDWADMLEIALKSSQRLGDPQLEAEVLSGLGRFHNAAHQPDRAFSFHQEALRLVIEAGGHPSEAAILSSAASSLVEAGRFDEAMSYFEKSLTLHRKSGDIRGQGRVLHNMGTMLVDLGDLDRAVDFLREDLRICQKLGDRAGEGVTHNSLGRAYYDLQKYETAASHFQQSLNICREFRDARQEGSVLKNLANAHASAGRLSLSLDLYQQALRVQRTTGDRHGEGETLMNLAVTHEELRQIGPAIKCLEQAAIAFRETGDKHGIQAARRWLSNLQARSPFHNR
ncbi:tetratricopeptide repeat protein [Kitasatospora sp. NPDC004669]|uniref:ATP-binding protein n=1 Tax=Kitasatospora sp. NPDC004669 TaxID=3154555 RepID=UPI0033A5FB01